MVVKMSEEQSKAGNTFGAWEAVERVYTRFPEDPEVTKMRSELSVKASEFVSAIEKAKQHEQRKQFGSSLSWYLKAKFMYQASEYAKTGIDRVIGSLKDDGSPGPDALPTSAP